MSRSGTGYRSASWWAAGRPARVVTPAAPEQSVETEPTEPQVQAVDELRYGYTMADLHVAARLAVHTDWSHHAGDYLDRLHLAHSAAAIALYEATERPETRDLVAAAHAALTREVQQELRMRGISHHTYEPAPRAYLYWSLARVTHSHEDTVVDRRALAQIWPYLTESERAALMALATLEDYQVAADALGLSYNTFAAQVRRARRRYLALWHEGEVPSRPWGTDRRAGRKGERATAARTAVRAIGRRRAAVRRAAA